MRDVIQVERQDGAGAGPDSLAQLARVADELLPPLVARLGVSELGEIEVRQGTWRVRIRRAVPTHDGATAAVRPAVSAPGMAASAAGATTTAAATAADTTVVAAAGSASLAHALPAEGLDGQPMTRSTAVGYFGLRPGLAVGHRVTRGDALGWVDVLGVRVEIVAHTDGVVERFVTEPGEPVEYGQELVAILAPTGAAAPAAALGEDAATRTAQA